MSNESGRRALALGFAAALLLACGGKGPKADEVKVEAPLVVAGVIVEPVLPAVGEDASLAPAPVPDQPDYPPLAEPGEHPPGPDVVAGPPSEEPELEPAPETPALDAAPFPSDPRMGEAWAELPLLPTALPPQAGLLAGLVIVLDPGHGGDIGPEFEASGYKRGPTGLREAVINMNTARTLQRLLNEAGATALLTREDDVEISLADRVAFANAANADLFISIHHNGGPPSANYSSVWYHRDGEGHPASLDIARELVNSLAWTIRPPQPLSSGIYSDNLIYESGFGVLRGLRMPGVLAECSFHSNPIEEQRLRHPEYNDRIAWALLDGLVRWAAAGVPSWSLAGVEETPSGKALLVEINDGMKEGWGAGDARIRHHTLEVLLDGFPVESVEWASGRVLRLRDARLWNDKADRALSIQFENRTKNASITPALVRLAGEAWVLPAAAPAGAKDPPDRTNPADPAP